jgi:hypothetical protein
MDILLALQLITPAAADPATTPTQWYGTQAGIVTATAIGVSILKRLLGNVPYVNTLPTWLYAVLVAGALTFLSVRVWGTMPGDLWALVSQSVLSAGASSGFYEWLTTHPTTSLARSAIAANVAVDLDHLPARDVTP